MTGRLVRRFKHFWRALSNEDFFSTLILFMFFASVIFVCGLNMWLLSIGARPAWMGTAVTVGSLAMAAIVGLLSVAMVGLAILDIYRMRKRLLAAFVESGRVDERIVEETLRS